MSLFKDRADAGRQLAGALHHLGGQNPIVLGLARGGLVLGAEIARELECDMDVLVSRKVGAPHHPEYGIGAVAPGNIQICDDHALEKLFLTKAQFEGLAQQESLEVNRRLAMYRSGKADLDLDERVAILVDDGLATGVTALAACRYVRSQGPAKLVLAVPVCTGSARSLLEPEVDEFICLAQPEPFYAVGQWYTDFSQVEDREVLELLQANRGLAV